ncbi:Leucine-rich repeat transmembrane protein FLRT2-like Protein [Tribolium castaneum]|uniref:Leucine-rich repeat transmembrane protein FLRT2-like Protein n=1 Tax=Tribolium castaneum TaxID=7070 RepID=D2A593_TRICA|nr:PREDICTED: carboxypeptidase N subunit 2 [Tribolium castaneum]EFA05110.1 Leucine-rich repeat transmembrane protein FLRT2-like Protein [Tribolium castaneum]|eukprot:XP_008194682.1 PREDICTED: carboxypeptidase N subunit 2 [Tribolium castaneum]
MCKFLLIVVTTSLTLKLILAFCEESYVIICDDLIDIEELQTDGAVSWRHVLIGSNHYKSEPPNHILTYKHITALSRTKSLTILNQIKLITSNAFGFSNNLLQHLNFFNNKIATIRDHSFAKLENLREVYLENNEIHHLGRAIFKGTSLEIVNLSRNKLESITTAFLETRIKWLLLNHNNLSFIEARAFPDNLEQLELNHNNLEDLESNLFQNLHNLKELFIEHNLLKTVPDIAPLTRIQYLHFAHNQIQKVYYRFDKHETLEFVDFSSNFIRNVATEVFSSDSPPLVILTFNRLTNLEFNNWEKKTDLGLYGNPWNCDCLFKIETNLRKYKHLSSCEFPRSLNGKLPICVEGGKCEDVDEIKEADISRFREETTYFEDKIDCYFRL